MTGNPSKRSCPEGYAHDARQEEALHTAPPAGGPPKQVQVRVSEETGKPRTATGKGPPRAPKESGKDAVLNGLGSPRGRTIGATAVWG